MKDGVGGAIAFSFRNNHYKGKVCLWVMSWEEDPMVQGQDISWCPEASVEKGCKWGRTQKYHDLFRGSSQLYPKAP